MTITTIKKKGGGLFSYFDGSPIYYLEIVKGKWSIDYYSYDIMKQMVEFEYIKKDAKRLELFKEAIEKIELIDKGQEASIMNNTKNNN